MSFHIGDRLIGSNAKPFVIAEVAQAHDGSLGLAHSYIDLASKVGADAVKFQTHIASEESTLDEPFRINFSYEDSSRFDYWKRMEFTSSQWQSLKKHADSLGLIFISSPFSESAVNILQSIGVQAYKVGSGEVANPYLFESIFATGKPILVSTGMSSVKESNNLYRYLSASSSDFAVFQCTSKYPTPLDEVDVHTLLDFSSRFTCPVGLSDHSGTIYPGLYALANGVPLLELHITFNKNMFGPDTSSSLDPDEFESLCKARDAFHLLRNCLSSKDSTSSSLQTTAQIFGRSLCLRSDLPAGHIISASDLTLKKPAGGISFRDHDQIVGQTLKYDTSSNRLLMWDDFL